FPPAADGSDFFFVPPSNVPTIGDALSAKNVSWRYYGGGFNDAVAGRPNAFCGVCNPMQYATSIMTNAAARAEHIKDVIDFFPTLPTTTCPRYLSLSPASL